MLDQLKSCTPVALCKSHPPERPSIFGYVWVSILEILNNGKQHKRGQGNRTGLMVPLIYEALHLISHNVSNHFSKLYLCMVTVF